VKNGFVRELVLMLVFVVIAIPLRMFTDLVTWQIIIAGLIPVLIVAGVMALARRKKGEK
jgi:hypothetical protein